MLTRHSAPPAAPAARGGSGTPLEPTPGLFMPPTPDRVIGAHHRHVAGLQRPAWFFLGAHGGAGVTTLAHYAQAAEARCWGMDADRAWPDPMLEPTDSVVGVARTHMAGLTWARDLVRCYLAGRAPEGTRLLGLVLVPDEPGRLPKPLASAVALLRGAYRHVWRVPYQPDLRYLPGLVTDTWPPALPDLLEVLAEIRTTATEGALR